MKNTFSVLFFVKKDKQKINGSYPIFVRITIDGVEYILHEGESIVMPAKHPHAVYGLEQFKMLLVVIF